jgi:hypothetical protein
MARCCAQSWTTRRATALLPRPSSACWQTRGGEGRHQRHRRDIGPGGYAALRVGVSIAKALAHALGVPLAGIGRLELDAWLVRADADGRRIVAVHAAGRGEAAVAAYRSQDGDWREDPPRLCKRERARRLRPR